MRCAACYALLDWRDEREVPFCPSCEKKWLSETLEHCGICGKRVTDCSCMPLAMQKAKCEGLYKLVYYTPKQRDAVQNKLVYHLKNGSSCRAAAFAAAQLLAKAHAVLHAQGIEASDTLLTYLPRSSRARLRTGTDQARALARALSGASGIPVEALIKRRLFANRTQKNLSPAARKKNAKRAYVVQKRADCRGKTVLLVDDLVTTGEGMAHAARLLRKMGAVRVICLCIATDVVNKDLGAV